MTREDRAEGVYVNPLPSSLNTKASRPRYITLSVCTPGSFERPTIEPDFDGARTGKCLTAARGPIVLLLIVVRTLAIVAVGVLIFWLRRYMTGADGKEPTSP